MSSPHNFWYLFSAYAATWAIHGTYLVILARRASRIRREIEKLKK
jgi:CcmD family protein